MGHDAAGFSEFLRPHFSGRKTILIGGHVASMRGLAPQLRALGAQRPFLLGMGVGSGEPPLR